MGLLCGLSWLLVYLLSPPDPPSDVGRSWRLVVKTHAQTDGFWMVFYGCVNIDRPGLYEGYACHQRVSDFGAADLDLDVKLLLLLQLASSSEGACGRIRRARLTQSSKLHDHIVLCCVQDGEST